MGEAVGVLAADVGFVEDPVDRHSDKENDERQEVDVDFEASGGQDAREHLDVAEEAQHNHGRHVNDLGGEEPQEVGGGALEPDERPVPLKVVVVRANCIGFFGKVIFALQPPGRYGHGEHGYSY